MPKSILRFYMGTSEGIGRRLLFLPTVPGRPLGVGRRKEIAQLQQSLALLAVRQKFLEFYCDLFFSCPLTPGFSKPDGAPNFGKLSIARRH